MTLPLTILIAAFCLTHTALAGDHLPGDTITNQKGTTLQASVRNSILSIELKLAPACKQPRIILAKIVGEPRRLGRMMQWDERWTVDRCGANSLYFIHFYFRGSVGSFKIEPPRS